MENENMFFSEETDKEEVVTSPFADSPYEAVTPETPKKKEKKAGNGWKITSIVLIFVALTCSALAIFTSVLLYQQQKDFRETVEDKLNTMDYQSGIGSGDSSITEAPETGWTPGQVYDRNVKAVVAISNQSLTTNLFGQVSETASSGSGFLISEDGYIVTNYHVVSGATTLKVITWDSKEYSAKLIGGDSANDLAVLKIEGENFVYTTLGNSSDMVVGDRVAAIGNPLGELTSTLTVGYVSAKDRAVNIDGAYINMLQTDAAINSGNSGGPLFNMLGEVIGITTAKHSGTSSSGAIVEGIGFAIPIDDVKDMITDLQKNGYVTGAYLGVMVQDVNAEAAEMYGFPTGAYIVEVTQGSCAQKAGVQVKDIVIALGDNKVTSMSDLTRALRKFKAGEKTTITVYRSGKQIDLEVTLDAKPNPNETNQQQSSTQQQTPQQGQQTPNGWQGLFPFFGG